MTKPIVRDPIYRNRHFDADVIQLCIRWYVTYRLSFRDLVEMTAERGIAAAQAFFHKALATTLPRTPRKITLDGHVPSRRALWFLPREHPCRRNVLVRTNKYLNNIIEQDHRTIKWRCSSTAGFKSFANAAIAISGIELAHRIRKQQFSFGQGQHGPDVSMHSLCALAYRWLASLRVACPTRLTLRRVRLTSTSTREQKS